MASWEQWRLGILWRGIARLYTPRAKLCFEFWSLEFLAAMAIAYMLPSIIILEEVVNVHFGVLS